MEDVVKIASYISQRYEYQFGVRIDEMKLHILLYFIQRESLVQTGKPLFGSTFYAKSFGPFLPQVHAAYTADVLHGEIPSSSKEEYSSILDNVFKSLALKRPRSLSNLVHGEQSWRCAFAHGEDMPISISDIEKDANRFRTRCFLLDNLNKFRKPAYA